MKIDLSDIDLEQFNVREGIVAGEVCFLVYPKAISANWTQENKIFRSSMWNKDGELVSASFPKFTNWGEREDIFPLPNSLVGTTAVTKVDGSALIVSRYKGETIIRTRGTFDASQLELSGHEIELLKEKYPFVFDFGDEDTCNRSFIYEWTTPNNKIVLDYGDEPRLFLVGCVRHEDYSLLSQRTLDEIKFTNLDRPETHLFTGINDMIDTVKRWQGLEGICLYSKDGQVIHKIKADSYLTLHHFKSNATLENTVDLYFQYGRPDFKTFQAKLIEEFDYECASLVLGYCSSICDAWKEVVKIEEGMQSYVDKISGLTRKEQALKIMGSYGNTNRSAYVFTKLDGKPLNDDKYKKLMWQVMKK